MPNEGSRIRPPRQSISLSAPTSRDQSPVVPPGKVPPPSVLLPSSQSLTAPSVPDELVRTAKAALDSAGNLRRDIKVTVLQCLKDLATLAKGGLITSHTPDAAKTSHAAEGDSWLAGKLTAQTNTLESMSLTLKQLIDEHNQGLQERAMENKALNSKLTEIASAVEANHKTYASAAALSTNKNKWFRTEEELHTVIVSSDDPLKTSEDVEGIIKKSVNVRALGIGVSTLRKGANQKVVVSLQNAKDKDKFKEALKSSSPNITTADGTRRNPMVIFRGLIKGTADEDLRNSIVQQNRKLGVDADSLIRLCYKKGHRNSLLCSMVYEVSPAAWKTLVDVGRVNVGYQRVAVDDESPLVQCYQCLGYGHTQKLCKGKLTCSHCSQEHYFRDCPNRSTSATCSNCAGGQQNHNTMSDLCPIRRKMEERARDRINYRC